MIDAALQPLQQRFLQSPAKILANWGVVTRSTGWLRGRSHGCACPTAFEAYFLALLLLFDQSFARWAGRAVARQTNPTDRGAFLDISCDFLFYALFPLGLRSDPVNTLPAAVLITSFVGTGSLSSLCNHRWEAW